LGKGAEISRELCYHPLFSLLWLASELSWRWWVCLSLFFFGTPHGMRDFTPPSRDLTHAPCSGIACVSVLSRFICVRLFVTLWTVALQAPLSMGFSRQESWSGLPCPPPGDLPNPCRVLNTELPGNSQGCHLGKLMHYNGHLMRFKLF